MNDRINKNYRQHCVAAMRADMLRWTVKYKFEPRCFYEHLY
jgi:hypothetical protein